MCLEYANNIISSSNKKLHFRRKEKKISGKCFSINIFSRSTAINLKIHHSLARSLSHSFLFHVLFGLASTPLLLLHKYNGDGDDDAEAL